MRRKAALGEKRAIALKIFLGIGEVCGILIFPGLGLIQRRLEGAGVDTHQNLAFLHVAALAERNLDDAAGNLEV